MRAFERGRRLAWIRSADTDSVSILSALSTMTALLLGGRPTKRVL
jgi:hypothetical protein